MIRKSASVWLLILLLVGLSGDDLAAQNADTAKEPKSKQGQAAKANFAKGLQSLEDDYAAKLKRLRDTYIEELDNARIQSLGDGDLDETKLLLELRGEIVQAEKAEAVPAKGFHILQVRYGAKDSWDDVTAQVKKMVKNSRLVAFVPEKVLADAAFGTLKYIVIVYAANGKVNVAVASQEKVITLPLAVKR